MSEILRGELAQVLMGTKRDNKKSKVKKAKKSSIKTQTAKDLKDKCFVCEIKCRSEFIKCDDCGRCVHGNCVNLDSRDITLINLCSISFVCIICNITVSYTHLPLPTKA